MNLSMGGMFIRTADPPVVGQRLRIEVEWASTVIPLAEAEVVWTRSPGQAYAAGFGVRFTRVDGLSREMLQALVKQGGSVSALRVAREVAVEQR